MLLGISCENIFALPIVIALTACPFSIKKCAKMSVFLCENCENSLAAGGYAPRPPVVPHPPCQILGAPLLRAPSFYKISAYASDPTSSSSAMTFLRCQHFEFSNG